MNKQSLEQLYSSKTDDELLTLAEDGASLQEDAKSVLADELRRRSLDAAPSDSDRRPKRDGASFAKSRLVRVITFGGILILNICVALFGTALLETEIGGMFHPHSIAGVLSKVWSLSVLGAAIIGFFMWRTWKTEATKWTWVLPALWFGLRFITSRGNGGIWSHFSGADCVNGARSPGCTDFFAFTIPFVRGVAYSVGARFSSILSHPTQSSVNTIDGDAHAAKP